MRSIAKIVLTLAEHVRMAGVALAGAASICGATPLAAQPAETAQHSAPVLYVSSEAPEPAYVVPDQPTAEESGNASTGDADAEDHPLPFVLSQGVRRVAAPVRGKARATATAYAAPLFGLPGTTNYERALDCMTLAIAYEAGTQPVEGLESVGQVIINRMRASRYPKSVCGVVFQGAERNTGCQFTFTCDGSLRRHLSEETLARSRTAAIAVLAGATADHVAGATNYHADYVLPYWAFTGTRVTKIGAHIFYRMPGDGKASAGAGPLGDEPELALARLDGWRGVAVPLPRPAPQSTVFAPWGLPITATAQK